MIITLDGPAGSGKSTLAQAIAQHLGIYYINSGFIYRGFALGALNQGIALDDLLKMPTALLHEIMGQLCYYYDPIHKQVTIFINGIDHTKSLKKPQIDQAASILSMNMEVRYLIIDYIRVLAQRYACSIDGRDCGSVMFPQATCKFYITAALTVRAQRWLIDQAKKGTHYSLEQACDLLQERDERDSQRLNAPLVIPEHAYIVDTSELTADQTVTLLLDYIQKKETV